MKVRIRAIENEDLVQKLDKELAKKGGAKAMVVADKGEVKAFAKKHNYTIAEVDNIIWLRNKNVMTERKITKFVEAIWRFVFYANFVVYGAYVLFYPEPASWVTDGVMHWKGWPLFDGPIPANINLYYQMELGCYLHQLMWTEVNRSDAVEMIVHHLATISVMFLSYLSSFHRVGASILLTHDVADIFLECGKCFNYAARVKGASKWYQRICDIMFGFFAVTFFISRLVLYPKYMLSSLIWDAPVVYNGVWPGYYAFTGLLSILQCLHVFWFYLILRMVVRLMSSGGIDKDERSDDEDDGGDSDDDGAKPTKRETKKGK
jgi:ceramide synthetase